MAKRKTYVVIQEGGTSTELYVHSHHTLRNVREDRDHCAAGSYRTTQPVEIPPECAALGEKFYGAVEAILESLDTLGYP